MTTDKSHAATRGKPTEMMRSIRRSIDGSSHRLSLLALLIILSDLGVEDAHAAQALLLCTVLQTPTQDNTNTEIKIVNNCCKMLPAVTQIDVAAGQTGVQPTSIKFALKKPLVLHKAVEFEIYVRVPRATWCSAHAP
jgi:hypothetical protein